MITTDQHHHDHQQYSDNHHDHDEDDQEHPACAGQCKNGEQEVQQQDHVEPFCPGRFFVGIFITNIVYVICTCIIDCISSTEPAYDNLDLDETEARPTWSTALRARTAAAS